MEYVKNPNFYEGNILRAADLVAMEGAVLQNQTDIQTIKATHNDWNITDATALGYINNKPLSYQAKTYTWDGKSYNADFLSIPAIKIESEAPNKEVLIDGSLSAVIGGVSYPDLIIERICNTRLEINDFLNDTTDYHALIVNGLAFNYPAVASIIALAGQHQLYPIGVLLSETINLNSGTSSAITCEKGFYLLQGSDYYGTSSSNAYCSALAFIDIIVKEEYQPFFKQFENNIKLFQIQNPTDIINYQLFKPGDIVYAVVDMNTVIGELTGEEE